MAGHVNEGHTAGPQLVGQLTEDDPVGQSLGQVIGQGPLQLGVGMAWLSLTASLRAWKGDIQGSGQPG